MQFYYPRTHFWVSIIAALFMGAMILESDQNRRALLVVPLILFYFGAIALFGLEHETATRHGIRKYVSRLLGEFEEKEKGAEAVKAVVAPAVLEAREPRKVSREALDYVLSRV